MLKVNFVTRVLSTSRTEIFIKCHYPVDFLMIFHEFDISVNPAVSKHKVYRHNHENWSSGYHHISWDPDAAELQDDDKVDIHLFSLQVYMQIVVINNIKLIKIRISFHNYVAQYYERYDWVNMKISLSFHLTDNNIMN